MKTTIDFTEALLLEGKAVASAQQKTFKELLEDGLRMIISKYKSGKKTIEIKPVVVGSGDIKNNLSWSEIQKILEEEDIARFKK